MIPLVHSLVAWLGDANQIRESDAIKELNVE